MSKPLLVSPGVRLDVTAGVPIRHREWADLVAWNHSWDAKDAAHYPTTSAEASAFAITAGQNRIHTIADRGSGRMPLRKDNATFGTVYSAPMQLPGPQHIPSSARFNGLPAMRFDIMNSGGAGGPHGYLLSMLSPNAVLPLEADTSTWMNPPNGYPQPYWVAVFGRTSNTILDSTLGNTGAGPTVTSGAGSGFGTLNKWCTSCWHLDVHSPPYFISSSRDLSLNETVCIIIHPNSTSSFLEVNTKDTTGAFQTVRTTGTQDNNIYKDLFFGWVDVMGYMNAAGVKTGVPTEAELDAVRSYCFHYMPTAALLPAEP